MSPSATGLLVNTATVTPAAGTTDTNPANDSATDTDLLTPQVNLTIVKTDGAAVSGAGHPDHVLDRRHQRRSVRRVTGAAVVDALPAALTQRRVDLRRHCGRCLR